VGRSMLRNVELGMQLGRLKPAPGLLVSQEEAALLPPSRVVILSTGSQAEARSGLYQLVHEGTNPLSVALGDLVVLSARTIPGHERQVTSLIDAIYARGARVAYSRVEPGIHVSGHGGRAEQRQMLQTVKPRHLVPIHGEMRHLHRHLGLAREEGVHGLLAKNGDVIEFDGHHGALAGRVSVGRTLRDRFGPSQVGSQTLLERHQLAERGLVTAVLALERTTGALVAGPMLQGMGLADQESLALPHVAAEAREVFLKQLVPAVRADTGMVREELISAVKKGFRNRGLKRPQVLVEIVRV
jgi:ribonuclease J